MKLFCTILYFVLFIYPVLVFSISNNFKKITTRDGLPQNSINYIFKDSKSQMWISTQNGLCRYNGFDFEIYGPASDSEKKISDVFVFQIIEDEEGFLWVCTRNGIDVIKNNKVVSHIKWKGYNYLHQVTDIMIYYNSVLIAFNNSFYQIPQGINSSSTDLLIDNSFINKNINGENLFLMKSFSKNEFIFIYDSYLIYEINKEKRKVEIPIKLSKNGGIDLGCEKYNNNIIIGTHQGIIIYNLKTGKVSEKKIDLLVNDIKTDPYNNLWLATSNGIIILNEKLEQSFHFKNEKENSKSISYNFVQTLYMDNHNQMWAGTANRGINIYDFDFDKFLHIKTEKLKNSVVWSICKNADSLLFLGLDDGILVLKEIEAKGKYYLKNYSQIQYLNIGDRVTSVIEKNNTLYFGAQHSGVYKWNLKDNPKKISDIVNVSELCIVNNSIYIASHYGFFQIDLTGEKIKEFSVTHDSSGLSMSYLLSVKKGENNNLWLTGNNGLSELKLSSGLFEHYPFFDKSNTSNGVNYLMNSSSFDFQGKVYIASMGGGLNILNNANKTFSYVTSNVGLQNDLIFSLTKVDTKIWMALANGISLYDTKTHKLLNYDFSNGIEIDEFAVNSLYSNSNEVIFGGTDGFVYFQPDKFNKNGYSDSIFLEKIMINHNQFIFDVYKFNKTDVVQLIFYSDNFKKQKDNRYEYYIEGYSNEWTVAPFNKILLPILPSGKYIFKIRFNKKYENNSIAEFKIPFIIITPYYKTTWFLVLIVFTFILIFFTSIAMIIKQKNSKKQKELLFKNKLLKEKERISREMHDNIGVNLTHIINSISTIISQSNSKQYTNQLSELRDFSKNTMLNLRSAIWSINRDIISFKLLQLKVTEIVQTLTKNYTNIKLNFYFEGDETYIVSSQLSINVIRIVQESVNNVIKHANASKLDISLIAEKNSMKLIIADDGIGINKNDIGNGFGLSNIINRGKDLSAKTEIKNKENGGTEINIIFPID